METLTRLVTVFTIFLYASAAYPQEVRLPRELSNDSTPFEFSSLGLWETEKDDYIILTPTLKGRRYSNSKRLYAIAKGEIIKGLTNHEVNYFPIPFDEVTYNRYMGKIRGYGGIEGTAIVGSKIYFSVECDSICYVIEGAIEVGISPKYRIVLKDTMSVEKPSPRSTDREWTNDGFEGITYLKAENRLLIAYEKKYGEATPKAFTMDLNLKSVQEYSFPMTEGRLPDFVATDDNRVICISSRVRYSPKLMVSEDTKAALAICTNLDSTLNWEGITWINTNNMKGVLMINDNRYGSKRHRTKLFFVPVN